MDAWEQLTSGSTLVTGDAWEHLLHQQGGGTYEMVVLADGLEIEMGECEFVVELAGADLSVDFIAADFEVEIEEVHYEIEVCDG
jgi:hypothetical protein